MPSLQTGNSQFPKAPEISSKAPAANALSLEQKSATLEEVSLLDSLTLKQAKENRPAPVLKEVKSQFSGGVDLKEFDSLFSKGLNLPDFQSVLAGNPELVSKIAALPQGPETLQLLKVAATRKLNTSEIRQLQTFLVQSTGANIKYPGHATGLDGDYGSRTHAALVSFVRTQLSQIQPVGAIQTTPNMTPERLNQLLPNQRQSLATLARVVQQLPTEVRSQIASSTEGRQFLADLETAGQRPLSASEIQSLQGFLIKQGANLSYKGHPTGRDGQYGDRTYHAIKQFLSKSFSDKSQPLPSNTGKPESQSSPSQPNSAKLPADGPYPRYDRMLDDNLLDVTMAMGYDEGAPGYAQSHLSEEIRLTQEIQDRGFVRDDAKALSLLKKAGREVNGSYSAFYVKENIAQANGQPVHSIVRVITSGDGQSGALKRKAALEGMNQSDVFMYGGHARFGTGPDFDSNLEVTIDWEGVPNAKGQGKVTYQDETELKNLLSGDGNDSKALAALKKLQSLGKVTISGQNQGNLRIGSEDKHPYEFGSYLMNQGLKDTSTQTLAEEITADKYRLWLFNGCRTHDYQEPIRAQGKINPALQTENLDLIMTNQTLWWENTSASLVAFLDGVMSFDKASDLNSRLQKANPEQGQLGKTHVRQGFDDNPLTAPVSLNK
jgi:peptidoglycan hydrolase-like protein with peptidoglycan-binding domain